MLACEPKGHWFDSQSGHMPGLRGQYPDGGVQDATDGRPTEGCFSHASVFLSLSLTLPSLSESK